MIVLGYMEQPTDQRIIKIAAHIKALRKKAGYTSYEKFALDVEIERKQYWRIEKGQNITLATLLIILDKLDMTLPEFFTGID